MEVCVDCIESAVNAEQGGAIRLELCSALSEGGLTPTPGLLKAVTSAVRIPVFCMLRARRGADFHYSREEVEAMKTDALLLQAVGRVAGFVFGALTEGGEIDRDVCQEIVQCVSPLPVTFHRAIDVCVDPFKAIHIVADLGFKRILTSGREENAEKGIPNIKEIVKQVGNKISIMVGAGVTSDNIAEILRETGAKEYHGTARALKSVKTSSISNASMGPSDMTGLMVTRADLVQEIIAAANSVLI